MRRAVIFGATNTGRTIFKEIKDEWNVIAFVDENPKLWGSNIEDVPVCNPDDLLTLKYDFLYVGVLTYYMEVMNRLHEMNIPSGKIIDRYVSIPTYARIEFLKQSKIMLEEAGISGYAVAELGVYKGEFAKEINRIFPESKLYLFDTFEGFSEVDAVSERQRGYTDNNQTGYFSDTSVQQVLNKMAFPNKCIVKKGFFPDTAEEIDENFVFVNIDVDLYEPILSGLRWFYPRMVSGGVILVHDYFSTAFTGARDAVKLFAETSRVMFLPVGDTLSVALRKV